MSVEDVWRAQRQWSALALDARDSLRRWRTVNLGLILVGAVAGALAAQDDWFAEAATLALGAFSAAALAVAGVVQARLLSAERVRRRLSTRAAAEALRGAVFRYLSAVPSLSAPDRAAELAAASAEVSRLAGAHAGLVVGVPPDDRPVPGVDGIVDYVRERARGQRDWHERRTVEHRNRARQWRAAELAATAGAACLAAVGGALHGPDLSAWVAVATTAAAAFGAHLATEQHDRIAESYARTVQSLDALLADFDPVRETPEEAARFVANVESVLADQNDSWVSIFAVQ
jgi:hypothetical protein